MIILILILDLEYSANPIMVIHIMCAVFIMLLCESQNNQEP